MRSKRNGTREQKGLEVGEGATVAVAERGERALSSLAYRCVYQRPLPQGNVN